MIVVNGEKIGSWDTKEVDMPVRRGEDGWYWDRTRYPYKGSKGPFTSREQAEKVGKVAYRASLKGERLKGGK